MCALPRTYFRILSRWAQNSCSPELVHANGNNTRLFFCHHDCWHDNASRRLKIVRDQNHSTDIAHTSKKKSKNRNKESYKIKLVRIAYVCPSIIYKVNTSRTRIRPRFVMSRTTIEATPEHLKQEIPTTCYFFFHYNSRRQSEKYCNNGKTPS